MSLAINSNGDIFVGTAAVGLWRTTNNGVDWSRYYLARIALGSMQLV